MSLNPQCDLTTFDPESYIPYSDDDTALMPDELTDDLLSWTLSLENEYLTRYNPYEQYIEPYLQIVRDILSPRNSLSSAEAEELLKTYTCRDLNTMINQLAKTLTIINHILAPFFTNDDLFKTNVFVIPHIILEMSDAMELLHQKED